MSHKTQGTLTAMRDAARKESSSHPVHSDAAKQFRSAAAAYQVALEAIEDKSPSLDDMILALEKGREEWRDNTDPNLFLSNTAAISRLRGLKAILP